jgi:hypothetical protein
LKLDYENLLIVSGKKIGFKVDVEEEKHSNRFEKVEKLVENQKQKLIDSKLEEQNVK